MVRMDRPTRRYNAFSTDTKQNSLYTLQATSHDNCIHKISHKLFMPSLAWWMLMLRSGYWVQSAGLFKASHDKLQAAKCEEEDHTMIWTLMKICARLLTLISKTQTAAYHRAAFRWYLPELRSGKNYDRWGPRNGLSQFLGPRNSVPPRSGPL